MAREGLMLPLRASINKAQKENKTVRKGNVRVNQNGSTRLVNLEVIPLKNLQERCFLVLFQHAEKSGSPASELPPKPAARRKTDRSAAGEALRRVTELEAELAETRDYLQSIQDQYEGANEELQASNEEVQSANEELQSINEELETSKEELESANEELTTVNEEMTHRNAELNRLNSDLVNIQTSAHLAIVLLGRDLTIRRFSAQAEKQFHLLATDIGRPFTQIRHNLVFEERRRAQGAPAPSSLRPMETRRRRADRFAKDPTVGAAAPADSPADLESFIAEVIASVRELQREVRDNEGRWYSLRVRPYLTLDNKVEGAVLVLLDINDLKRHEQSVALARDHIEAILRTARDPLVILNADLRVHTANDAFYSMFKVQPSEAEGRLIYDLGNRQWNIPRLRQLLEEILPRNSFFDNFELTHNFESIGRRTMLLNARTLADLGSQPARILLGIHNVTEVLAFQSAARESQTRYQALIEASAQIVWTTDPAGAVVGDSPSWSAFTGQTHEQRKGLGWLDILHPDDRDRVGELWQRAVTERAAVETEYRIRHISGDWRWTAVRAVPVSNPDGSVREWVGMNIDITGRQQGEEARARLAAIVESSDDAIVSKDLNGVIASWNKGAERLFGYTAPEVIGKPVTLLIPKERSDEEPSILERIRQGEHIEHFETVRRRKDGTLIDVSLTVSPIIDSQGQVVGASKIARDITERKRTEEALRRAAEFDEAVMANMGEGLYTVDALGLVTSLNPAAEKMLGWKSEELRGKRMHDMTHYKHPDGRPYPAEECAGFQVLTSGKTLTNYEDIFIRQDGTFFDVVYSSAPLKAGDATVGLVVVFRDVSERKRAEEALRQSHAELRAQAEELSRFNRVAVGREGRMIELKKEVNELCQRQGEPARYPLEFEQTRQETDD